MCCREEHGTKLNQTSSETSNRFQIMSVEVGRVSVGAGRAGCCWDICVTPCRDLPGHLPGFGHQEPGGGVRPP